MDREDREDCEDCDDCEDSDGDDGMDREEFMESSDHEPDCVDNVEICDGNDKASDRCEGCGKYEICDGCEACEWASSLLSSSLSLITIPSSSGGTCWYVSGKLSESDKKGSMYVEVGLLFTTRGVTGTSKVAWLVGAGSDELLSWSLVISVVSLPLFIAMGVASTRSIML